jgi:alpha-L-fucosidase
VYGEGPTEVFQGAFQDTRRRDFAAQDVRFTTKGNVLYAICLGWPQELVRIRSLAAGGAVRPEIICEIRMLGAGERLPWSQSEEGLIIQTPPRKPCDHAYTFRITLRD